MDNVCFFTNTDRSWENSGLFATSGFSTILNVRKPLLHKNLFLEGAYAFSRSDTEQSVSVAIGIDAVNPAAFETGLRIALGI